MQFDSFAEFLAMGGYAPFVWSSYGLVFTLMVALVMAPVVQRRQWIKEQRRQRRRIEAQRQAAAQAPLTQKVSSGSEGSNESSA